MKKFKFDFDLDMWIREVEIEAESLEEAKKIFNSKDILELISEGCIRDCEISSVDVNEE